MKQKVVSYTKVDGVVVRNYDIPKIITSDISFELMFGVEYPKSPLNSMSKACKSEMFLEDIRKGVGRQ